MLNVSLATVMAVLDMIVALLPALGVTPAASVTRVIAALDALLPVVIQEVSTLGPVVKGIIDTLKGGNVVTAEDLASLDAMNVQMDAAFDDAAKADGLSPAAP